MLQFVTSNSLVENCILTLSALFVLLRLITEFSRSTRKSVQYSRYVLLVHHHIRCRSCGLRLCSRHHVCIQLSKPDCLSRSHPCHPYSYRNRYWHSLQPRGFSPQRSDQTNKWTGTRIFRLRDGQYHQQTHRKCLHCRNLGSKRPFRLRRPSTFSPRRRYSVSLRKGLFRSDWRSASAR